PIPYGRAARRIAARTGARSQGASPETATRTRARSALGAGRGLDARDAVFGVWDALVVHAEEELAERVLDALDVAVCQIALVELTIRDALVDHPIHHRADRVRVLLGERSHQCPGAVGEHHDPGSLAPPPRTGLPDRPL